MIGPDDVIHQVADGLTVDEIDMRGLQIGNSDLVCERGTACPTGDIPFPVYPAQSDLPQIALNAISRKAT